MTLLLSNEEIEGILDVGRCVALLEEAYLDLAQGAATSGLRSEVAAPSSQPRSLYALKAYCAAYPRREVAALRLTSDLLTWTQVEGGKMRQKVPAAPGGRWVGLILLFSTRTGEPLALFPDGVIQRTRVGVTSALALRILARGDATELAIVGSGWQAGAHAQAACAVRRFRRVRVYSPNRAHRERFCATWEKTLGVPFQPVESLAMAVRGADAIQCATNSMQPLLEADSLEPGLHVGVIRVAEVGNDVLARADIVVRHATPEHAAHQALSSPEFTELSSDRGWTGSATDRLQGLPELTDLLVGRTPGRTRPEEITCFLNNGGIGLQFAVLGHAVWERARELGVGRELPTDWFTEVVHP